MPATKAVDQHLAHLTGLALIGIIITMILSTGPCFFSSLWPALPQLQNWNLSCHSETTLFRGYYYILLSDFMLPYV